MKNRFHVILGSVTALFAVFTLGVFLGRSQGADVYISPNIPDAAIAQPAAAGTPAEGTSPTSQLPSDPTEAIVFPLDLNAATGEMLEVLPGIGPVLAQRIVEYRDLNGPFRSLGELTKVEGIGQKKLEDILELIFIQEETTP